MQITDNTTEYDKNSLKVIQFWLNYNFKNMKKERKDSCFKHDGISMYGYDRGTVTGWILNCIEPQFLLRFIKMLQNW